MPRAWRGENIRESKQRIEQVMDTLVTAFEAQLDRCLRMTRWTFRLTLM